jgi:hypothetical protein
MTEGKLAAIFIKTFSWGFPTGRSFITHSHVNLAPEVFCRRCRVLKKKLSYHHHRAIRGVSGEREGPTIPFRARGELGRGRLFGLGRMVAPLPFTLFFVQFYSISVFLFLL